jgi:hypothetical protein
MTLYVTKIDENTLITHDGNVQTGYFKMRLEDFLEQVKVEYIETYWIPDCFLNRYKRANYQKHLNYASIDTKDK